MMFNVELSAHDTEGLKLANTMFWQMLPLPFEVVTASVYKMNAVGQMRGMNTTLRPGWTVRELTGPAGVIRTDTRSKGNVKNIGDFVIPYATEDKLRTALQQEALRRLYQCVAVQQVSSVKTVFACEMSAPEGGRAVRLRMGLDMSTSVNGKPQQRVPSKTMLLYTVKTNGSVQPGSEDFHHRVADLVLASATGQPPIDRIEFLSTHAEITWT